MIRNSRTKDFPHVVRLPKNAVNLGHRFDWDIVSQSRVLSTYTDAPRIIRSSESFIIVVKLTNGKIRKMESKQS